MPFSRLSRELQEKKNTQTPLDSLLYQTLFGSPSYSRTHAGSLYFLIIKGILSPQTEPWIYYP